MEAIRVGRAKQDVLQGTLTLLVLKTLSKEPLHGYAITQHIQTVSRDQLRVEEGSLYPALHRMEQAGWVAAEWQLTDNGRRARIYRLTRTGRRRFLDYLAVLEGLVRDAAKAAGKEGSPLGRLGIPPT